MPYNWIQETAQELQAMQNTKLLLWPASYSKGHYGWTFWATSVAGGIKVCKCRDTVLCSSWRTGMWLGCVPSCCLVGYVHLKLPVSWRTLLPLPKWEVPVYCFFFAWETSIWTFQWLSTWMQNSRSASEYIVHLHFYRGIMSYVL